MGNAALPARVLCPQQPVDEAAEPVCLGNDGDRDRDAARPQQEEVTLDLLVFRVGGFEVLMAVAEGAAAGLREPEHRVVGSSGQVVLEVGEAAREGELGDAGRDVHREVERDEAGAAARQVGTVDGGASGRGACWLMVVLEAAGVRLSRAAAGRERSELALDRRMPVAYSVLMSQHAPRPDAPDTSPTPIPPPAACRRPPDPG